MTAPAPRVAVVTGASSGIGRATCIALSTAGWAVVLFARRAAALDETRALCPGPTHAVQGDVAREDDVTALFAAAVAHFGRVDLLFNNAGIGAPAIPMEDLPVAKFEAVLATNVLGTFLCSRAAVRLFKTQSPPGGRIINNGSLSAHTPRPHSTAYTASKHAVSGLTKATALDGRAHGISVTQIDVGNAFTPLAARMAQGVPQADGTTRAEATFDARHVADAVVHVAGLPAGVQVLEMNIMATEMPFVGRG